MKTFNGMNIDRNTFQLYCIKRIWFVLKQLENSPSSSIGADMAIMFKHAISAQLNPRQQKI